MTASVPLKQNFGAEWSEWSGCLMTVKPDELGELRQLVGCSNECSMKLAEGRGYGATHGTRRAV